MNKIKESDLKPGRVFFSKAKSVPYTFKEKKCRVTNKGVSGSGYGLRKTECTFIFENPLTKKRAELIMSEFHDQVNGLFTITKQKTKNKR